LGVSILYSGAEVKTEKKNGGEGQVYFLSLAAFALALYFLVEGDMQYARYALATTVVLAAFRFFFGAQERASVLSRIGFAIQILFFIAIAAFALDLIFEQASRILP
jgi:hypothetical protein